MIEKTGFIRLTDAETTEGRSDDSHGASGTGAALVWCCTAASKPPTGSGAQPNGAHSTRVALEAHYRIKAAYTKQRERRLAGANLGFEKLRFLCRLAPEAPRPSLTEK